MLAARDRNEFLPRTRFARQKFGVERKRASAAAVDEILTRKPEPSGDDGAG